MKKKFIAKSLIALTTLCLATSVLSQQDSPEIYEIGPVNYWYKVTCVYTDGSGQWVSLDPHYESAERTMDLCTKSGGVATREFDIFD